MIAPAAIYLTIVHGAGEPALARGWAIPCATDIAFSYHAAQFVFGPRHAAIPFLLLLAIADDAPGLMTLAVFYPTGEIRLMELLVLLVFALAAAYWLRRRRVASFWPYVAGAGALSWLAILFAFGLVNAGVPLDSVGLATWAVLAAILLGKPLGIVGFTLIGRQAGLRLPHDLGWRELVVVGAAAAIGFTVALFFATAAFPNGPILAQAKSGALLSIAGAIVAAAGAAGLRVGRFARS